MKKLLYNNLRYDWMAKLERGPECAAYLLVWNLFKIMHAHIAEISKKIGPDCPIRAQKISTLSHIFLIAMFLHSKEGSLKRTICALQTI